VLQVQHLLKRNTKVSTVIIALVAVILATLAFGGAVPTPCAATVETVGVGVYWDSGCSNRVSSIEWGTIEAGAVKTVTVYVRNEGDVTISLSLSTTNWSPSTASKYMSLSWNYDGQPINPNGVIPVTLTLSVSPSITGISSFSFDIIITCVEAAPPPTPRPGGGSEPLPPPPDVTPPKISITGPEPQILIASTSVTVRWAAVDDESGIDHYLVYLNNEPVINTTDVSWELLGLVEGFNNVTVTAYDKEGNFASDQIGIIVDLTPPSVRVTSPKDGCVTMGTDVTVEWIGSDRGSGISYYRVYLDDVEVMKTTSTSCWLTALTESDHIIKVEAYDLLNHTSSDKITITIDNTAPIIEITKPMEKAYVKGMYDIVIYGLDANFHPINLYIDEALINAWSGSGTQTYALDTTKLTDGPHTIKLIVYDEAGNAFEDVITVTVDNTAPKVWVDAPSSGAELAGVRKITFTVSDTHLARVLLYIDNEVFDASGEMSYEWDTSSVNDGFHTIKILAIDEAENMGETQISVKAINIQKAMESRDLFLSSTIIGALSVSVIGPIIVFAIDFIEYRADAERALTRSSLSVWRKKSKYNRELIESFIRKYGVEKTRKAVAYILKKKWGLKNTPSTHQQLPSKQQPIFPTPKTKERKKDLSRLLSKLFNVTETGRRIQNENQARKEEHQKSPEEIGSEACPHFFGYLRTLPRNDTIPDECLVCIKVTQCMNRHTNG